MPSLLSNSLCKIRRHKILYRRILQNNNYASLYELPKEMPFRGGRTACYQREDCYYRKYCLFTEQIDSRNIYICWINVRIAPRARRFNGGDAARSWWPRLAFNKGYGRPSLPPRWLALTTGCAAPLLSDEAARRVRSRAVGSGRSDTTRRATATGEPVHRVMFD